MDWVHCGTSTDIIIKLIRYNYYDLVVYICGIINYGQNVTLDLIVCYHAVGPKNLSALPNSKVSAFGKGIY